MKLSKNFLAFALVAASVVMSVSMVAGQTRPATLPTTAPAPAFSTDTLDQLIGQIVDPTLAGQIRASLSAVHVDPAKVKAVDPFTSPGELSAILANAVDGGTLYLTPGGVYPSTATATLKANNYTIVGNGATIQVGPHTAIMAQGANLEIGGVNVTGSSCFVRGQAPGLKVHDCHATDLWQFSILDWPASGATFANCTGVRTVKAYIFCQANNSTYHNLHVDGSNDEHCLRITGDGTHPIPDGALIDGGEWGYVEGAAKGTFAFRNVTNLKVQNAIVHGAMTGGQASGLHNVTGSVTGCTFDYNGLIAGGQAQFQAGVALTWTNNTHVITNVLQQAVAVGTGSVVNRTGNAIHAPAAYQKHLVFPPTSAMPQPDDTKVSHP